MEGLIKIYNKKEKYLQLIKDSFDSFIKSNDYFIYTYIEILYIHINKLLNNSDDYQNLTIIKKKIDTITCLLLILSFLRKDNFIIENGESHEKDINIYEIIINILKTIEIEDKNIKEIRTQLITLKGKDKIEHILNTPELQINNEDDEDKILKDDFIEKLKNKIKEQENKPEEDKQEKEEGNIEKIKIIFQIKIMHDLFMLNQADIDTIKKF